MKKHEYDFNYFNIISELTQRVDYVNFTRWKEDDYRADELVEMAADDKTPKTGTLVLQQMEFIKEEVGLKQLSVINDLNK